MLIRFAGTHKQYDEIEERVSTEDLVDRNLIQSFAPDTLGEAVNRGFRPMG